MTRPQMTTAEREAFLAEPRVAILTVDSENERPPLATPVFYNYEPGGAITFFTGTMGHKSRKSRLIERAGTVSLCVQQPEMPYKYVTVEGTVVQAEQPAPTEPFLAILRRYMPEDHAQGMVAAELAHPGGGPILYTIRPDHWITFDLSPEPATD